LDEKRCLERSLPKKNRAGEQLSGFNVVKKGGHIEKGKRGGRFSDHPEPSYRQGGYKERKKNV